MADLPIINATVTVTGIKNIGYQRKQKNDDGSVALIPSTFTILKSNEAPDVSCFDTLYQPLILPGARLNIGYTEKYATNNDGTPKMDDYTQTQKVYRNLSYATPVEGAQQPTQAPAAPQNGAFSAPATPGSPAPQMSQDRNESIREQTCLKAAAEMYAAVLGANKALKWEFDEFARIFEGTKATLDGKNELDAMMDKAKDTMEVVEMPGPDAPENPEDHEFDGTF